MEKPGNPADKPDIVTAQDLNPHRRLHGVIYVLTVLCLIVQVLEGALVVPVVLLYFGFPQLGVKDICDEMYKIVYRDETRICNYPYPLFEYEPEPWLEQNREDIFGEVTPPAPRYELPGFRGVIEKRRLREARGANQAVIQQEPQDE